MVVMRNRTQADWLHSIPKRAKASGRINITFRKAKVVVRTGPPRMPLAQKTEICLLLGWNKQLLPVRFRCYNCYEAVQETNDDLGRYNVGEGPVMRWDGSQMLQAAP